MTRHCNILLKFLIGGLLLGFVAFAGCQQEPRAAIAPPNVGAGQKSQSAPQETPARKANEDGSNLPPGPGTLSKQEPEVPKQPTEVPTKAEEKTAGKESMPPSKEEASQGGIKTENENQAAKQEETPGFLSSEPVERKFPFEIPANWKRLSEKEEIWIDNQEKLVIVSGRICLTRGLLEMFACPKGMKEHESVVATYPMAMYVHQALLLIGANPGRTVQWEPEYKPAEGPKVQVECWYYNQKNELVKENAKEMVKLVSDGSPLKIDWVFGGSKFVTDPDGRELYAANGGELICLSNFSSAMIDLPIPSTAEAGGLLYEANSEKIPPLDTPVLLVLKPEIKLAGEKSGEGSGGK